MVASPPLRVAAVARSEPTVSVGSTSITLFPVGNRSLRRITLARRRWVPGVQGMIGWVDIERPAPAQSVSESIFWKDASYLILRVEMEKNEERCVERSLLRGRL